MVDEQHTPRVLVVGNWADDCLAVAREFLQSRARVVLARDVGDARRKLRSASHFELIIVLQEFSGQIPAEQIHTLQIAAPLTGVVALLGPWCEGEGRAGRPWPAATRTYWHQWPCCARRPFDALRAGGASTWQLLCPISDDDRLLAGMRSRSRSRDADRYASLKRVLVAIVADDRAMSDLLVASVAREGAEVVGRSIHELPTSVAPAIVIWDICRPAPMDELLVERATIGQVFPRAKLVALCSFPRPDWVSAMKNAGAAAVVSKPLRIDELIGQVRCLVEAGPAKTDRPTKHGLRSAQFRVSRPARAPARSRSA